MNARPFIDPDLIRRITSGEAVPSPAALTPGADRRPVGADAGKPTPHSEGEFVWNALVEHNIAEAQRMRRERNRELKCDMLCLAFGSLAALLVLLLFAKVAS